MSKHITTFEKPDSGSVKTYFNPRELLVSGSPRSQEIHRDFTAKIDAGDYPCLGAKAALHTGAYRIGIYGRMHTPESTEALGRDLQAYIRETTRLDSQYMSMIAVFDDQAGSEEEFEEKLWTQLQALHDSEKAGQPWDPAVASDPESDCFSFSYFSSAFFIVGMHPHSSRKARRFPHLALAFNLHRQFEQLRDNENYEKMKQTIRQREMEYQGSINPMLSDHGEGSEAAQYSGRKVGKDWKCPFHPRNS